MASDESKARQYLAKFHSYSNAAEFIRSHGEEGFSFEDEKLQDLYFKQNKRTANTLDKIANKWYQKYLNVGIEINSEISENY